MGFLKKLAKKGVNKLKAKAIDKVTDAIFGGFGGKGGRTFGFGGATVHHSPRSSLHGTLDYRSHFHNALTEAIEFQTPNRSLWHVVIENFPIALNTSNIQMLECGGQAIVDGLGPNKSFHYNNYDNARETMTNPMYQNQQGGKDQTAGCLFAQGINLPTEQMSTSRVSVENNRGFVPGLVGGNRNEFNPLSIEFRETNGSFVDTMIRPWVTLASHYGFVARGRSDPKNIKTNIIISQIGINGHDSPYIRKRMMFHNCVPFQIAQQQYTYDVDGGQVPPIDVQWAYTNYSIQVAHKSLSNAQAASPYWNQSENFGNVSFEDMPSYNMPGPGEGPTGTMPAPPSNPYAAGTDEHVDWDANQFGF